MEVVHPRCCGLDVHKSISACVVIRERGKVEKLERRFGTFTPRGGVEAVALPSRSRCRELLANLEQRTGRGFREFGFDPLSKSRQFR
jgi:hypothetical protein